MKKEDAVDRILQQWAQERPDLDVSPMGVIGRISRVSRVLERSIDETFSAFGLGRGGFDVLAALRRSGSPFELSPTELYNSLLISSGAMTNRIDRLERRGLVTRSADPQDRRGVIVGLTPKGKDVIDEAVAAHCANEHLLLSRLSSTERETLGRLLRKLLIQAEHPSSPSDDGKRRRELAISATARGNDVFAGNSRTSGAQIP